MKRLLLPLFALSLTGLLGSTTVTTVGAGASSHGFLVIDRSLVERELQRLEADSAYPEASPSPAPFTLRQYQAIVSEQTADSSHVAI